MQSTPHSSTAAKRPMRSLLAVAITFGIVAAACGGSADDRDAIAAAAQAIETNDGGVIVKPPDALEAGQAPEAVEPEAAIAAPVEGLNPTPVVAFNYFDGTPGSTADFTGRPTVVNFWASNCAACVAEMPDFEEVHLALAGQVDFVGVNVTDVSREAAVALAEQTGVTYPLVDDTSSDIFREFGGFVMPTTVLLNPQGQVAFSWAGVLTADDLTTLINDHILSE